MSIDDYQRSYDMYLAEDAMYESLIEAGAYIVLSEEVTYEDVISICEGLEDTVTNYVNKVLNSTQEAWSRFKANVGGVNQREYLRKNAEKVRNAKSEFNINNFPNYNLTTFRNYKVERFSYEIMKDDLKTQKEFMQKHYLSLYSDTGKAVTTMMNNNVIAGYSNIHVDRTRLIQLFNFCSRDFYQVRSSIEDDLATLNASADGIVNAVNSVVSAAQESVDIYNNIMNEAENTSNKLSFTDSDGEQVSPGQKAADTQNAFINCVSNYMKISTDIITAKMKLLARMYDTYMNCVRHYTDVVQYGSSDSSNNNTRHIEI